jgi:hypothetical protein
MVTRHAGSLARIGAGSHSETHVDFGHFTAVHTTVWLLLGAVRVEILVHRGALAGVALVQILVQQRARCVFRREIVGAEGFTVGTNVRQGNSFDRGQH